MVITFCTSDATGLSHVYLDTLCEESILSCCPAGVEDT